MKTSINDSKKMASHLIGVFDFGDTLKPETDRGCALVSTAYLDSRLENLLRDFFVPNSQVSDELLGQAKPIGTFSSRIDLSYALGLIGHQERRDLHLIRKIRNEFGHGHIPMDFDSPSIASRCRELRSKKLESDLPMRMRFVSAVQTILAAIGDREQWVNHTSECVDMKLSKIKRINLKDGHRKLIKDVLKRSVSSTKQPASSA